MALPHRVAASVPFTLEVEGADSQKFALSFNLTYDLNALAEAERQLEKERGRRVSLLDEVGEILSAVPSCRETTILLWAALYVNHEDWRGEDGLAILRSVLTLPDLIRAHRACGDALVTQLRSEAAAKVRSDMLAVEAAQ